MLTDLRQKSQSFIIYLLFGILIVVFISFGPGTQNCDGRGTTSALRVGWAAEVHGEEIGQQDVEILLRRGGDIDRDEDATRLRRLALFQLIDLKVLEQRARAAGLAVSEDEVMRYIMDEKRNRDFPLFARDGRFNYDLYQDQITQRLGTSTSTYRRMKGQELLIEKYLGFLATQVKVSEPEVREAWERAERKWNLEYVSVPAETNAEVAEPTVEEGRTFAAGHPDAVAKYFEEHKKEFDRGKEVRIRRILVKVAEGGGDPAKAEARAKAEALLAEARAPGADFAALARAKSEDYYKDYDGDMGWQSKENTNEHDFGLYDKLEAGGISEVVESPIGFWFVKAEEVRPPVKKTLDEARDEIGRVLAREEAKKKVARERADQVLAKAVETGSLAEAVKAVNPPAPPPPAPASEGEAPPPPPATPGALEVKETGLFSADRPTWERLPGIGESKDLAKRLSGLTPEKPLVDTVVEGDAQFLVVRLKERVEPDPTQFDAAKADVEGRLRLARQNQLFGNWDALLFGPVQQRELFLKFMEPALMATLPDPEKDPSIRINQEAFPVAAAPATESRAAN